MEPLRRRVSLPGPVDLVRTVRRFRLFARDPGMRRDGETMWCAFRTPDGPATIAYRPAAADAVDCEAWGPGAEHALERAFEHLGGRDDPESFQTDDPVVAPLLRRFEGLRFGRTGRVLERLLPTIVSQKVTGKGAGRSWQQILRRHGEPAPGPAPELWVDPSPERLRGLAYYDLHAYGIERKRAQVILDVVRRAKRIEGLAQQGAELAESRLLAMRGIGPWTTGTVLSGVFGDPDAIPVGDYHIPNTVSFAFTGEPRGDDARMLELLEPFRPHRGRVLTLLMYGGHSAPKYGPKMPVRNIRRH
ncbi:MAG: hypothetical protein RLO52_06925 [Sandaracinaceae bacterium]|nr:MAG: DNA-3-methyladenine glycosylase 2 family protein [Sandaracinaceae bacterium]